MRAADSKRMRRAVVLDLGEPGIDRDAAGGPAGQAADDESGAEGGEQPEVREQSIEAAVGGIGVDRPGCSIVVGDRKSGQVWVRTPQVRLRAESNTCGVHVRRSGLTT